MNKTLQQLASVRSQLQETTHADKARAVLNNIEAANTFVKALQTMRDEAAPASERAALLTRQIGASERAIARLLFEREQARIIEVTARATETAWYGVLTARDSVARLTSMVESEGSSPKLQESLQSAQTNLERAEDRFGAARSDAGMWSLGVLPYLRSFPTGEAPFCAFVFKSADRSPFWDGTADCSPIPEKWVLDLISQALADPDWSAFEVDPAKLPA